MSINRRKLIRITLLGGTSFATTSSIFFPKPAQAFELNFLLSNKTVQKVFTDIISYAAYRVIDNALSPRTNRRTQLAVQRAERKFLEREFTDDQTPFAQTGTSGLLWGRERQETLGPNAGLAIVQRDYNTAQFSGSTSVGIDEGMKVLTDEGFSPPEVNAFMIPVRTEFEDWGTWSGDRDPTIGRNENVALASYRTLRGRVVRRYELLEPGAGGLGRVTMTVEAQGQPIRRITTNVRFS